MTSRREILRRGAIVAIASFASLATLATTSCGGARNKPVAAAPESPDEAAARAAVAPFLDPHADHTALTKALRPRPEDYAAVFEPDAAERVRAEYERFWQEGGALIQARGDQLSVTVRAATTDELRTGRGAAPQFPGGWGKVASSLKPGLVFYTFEFVREGATAGSPYDGLVRVNGRWIWVPKPWRYVLP